MVVDFSIKFGYCPICDEEIHKSTNDIMCHCPTCGHHINLHEVKEE